jgi:hypothetical protein
VAQYGKDPHETMDYSAFLTAQLAEVIAKAKAAAIPVNLEAVRIGTTLAETIIKVLPKLQSVQSPSLAGKGVCVNLPLQRFGADQVARARTRIQNGGGELSDRARQTGHG